MELEAILNGNTFLLNFMGILYILLNKDFDKNQKIVVIYVFVYSLKLFNIVDLKILLIGLGVVSFLYMEFLSEDDIKNRLLSNIKSKFYDYMYKLFFEYSVTYFCIAMILMSKTFQTNFKILEIINIEAPIIGVKVNFLSLLFIVITINNITSQKFETYSFKHIKNKMDEIALWSNIKASNINSLKLNMLIDIEDKSFFERSKSYNFFSIEFFKYKTKKILSKFKKTNNSFKKIDRKKICSLKNIKKIKKYIRGYSTIEMQIIRTLGIKYGYENHVFCRKIMKLSIRKFSLQD